MRTQIHLYRRCAAALIGAVAMMAPATGAHAAFEARNVLFIGNSYTYNAVGYDGAGQQNPPYGTSYTNDGTSSDRFFADPFTSPFEAMVVGAGSKYGVIDPLANSQNIAVGGRRLNQHNNWPGVTMDRPTILYQNLNSSSGSVTDYDILNPNENGGITWDTIIIQEYSTTPGRTVSGGNYNAGTWDAFYTQGLSPIADKIKQYTLTQNPALDVVLFNTWGRAPGAFANGSSDEAKSQGFTSYEQMRDRTDAGYANALNFLTTPTDQTGITKPGTSTTINGKGFDADHTYLALVSQAFDFVINDPNRPAGLGDPFLLLYEDDFSHQAPAGEFLTAAVLFESIYGVSIMSFLDQIQLTGLRGGNDDFAANYSIPFTTAQYLAGVSQSITGVPEPASLVLLGAASLLLAARRRR